MGTSQVGISAPKGSFIPYFLSFENRSAGHQARRILNKVRLLAAQGYAKVGIIYSANDEQANKIIDAYRANNNNWAFTNNRGSNQGAVIAEIEALLKEHPSYQDLQKVFVIFPIATMSYQRQDLDQPKVAEQIMERDLGFIREHLENGAAVLGWQNQVTPRHIYAVGGGVATIMSTNQKLDNHCMKTIQSHLNQFMKNFPYVNPQKDVFDIQAIHNTMEHCLLRDDKIRCQFFLDTLDFLSDPRNQKLIQESAQTNFDRMRSEAKLESKSNNACQVEVYNQDWGSVTALLTKKYGEIFTVINITDPATPGSAASNGKDSLEASIFRRSNIALSIKPEQVEFKEINQLICFKKPETKMHIDGETKYTCDFLFPSEFFPFQELRSESFSNTSDPTFSFDFPSVREKIITQLEILKENNIKHIVLTSFNCGNHSQARELAHIYKEEIEKRQNDFAYIGFAIMQADSPQLDHYSAFCEKFAPAYNNELRHHRDSVESFGSRQNRRSLLINIMLSVLGLNLLLGSSLITGGLSLAFLIGGGTFMAIAAGRVLREFFPECCPLPLSSEPSPTQDIYSSFGHSGNRIDVSGAQPTQSSSFGPLPVNLSAASFALNAVAGRQNDGVQHATNAANTVSLSKQNKAN